MTPITRTKPNLKQKPMRAKTELSLPVCPGLEHRGRFGSGWWRGVVGGADSRTWRVRLLGTKNTGKAEEHVFIKYRFSVSVMCLLCRGISGNSTDREP